MLRVLILFSVLAPLGVGAEVATSPPRGDLIRKAVVACQSRNWVGRVTVNDQHQKSYAPDGAIVLDCKRYVRWWDHDSVDPPFFLKGHNFTRPIPENEWMDSIRFFPHLEAHP